MAAAVTGIDTDLQIDAYTPELLETLASILVTHHQGLNTVTDHHLSDLGDLIEVQRSGNPSKVVGSVFRYPQQPTSH